MSRKAVVLKRNSHDGAKFDQLKGIKPSTLVEYVSSNQLAGIKSDFGNLDYLIVTGGHGDFQSGKPSKFNDADITSTKTWIGNIKGEFKAVILDTCFSSALTASFLPFLPNGGCVVCAHGTGEGWAEGFSAANGTKSVGAILAGVVKGSSEVFEAMSPGSANYSSISLAVKKPINQLLYTANGGPNRGKGIATRSSMGMEVDTEIELKEVDQYLARDRINVVAVDDQKLTDLLKEHLTMKIV